MEPPKTADNHSSWGQFKLRPVFHPINGNSVIFTNSALFQASKYRTKTPHDVQFIVQPCIISFFRLMTGISCQLSISGDGPLLQASHLSRSTTWSMSAMFSLSLTASISSSAADWTEQREPGLKREKVGGKKHVRRETDPCKQDVSSFTCGFLTCFCSQSLQSWNPAYESRRGD